MAKPVSPTIPGRDFSEVLFAKDQPQYLPLPALVLPDGEVITRWQLDEEERQRVAETGELWLSVQTYHRPLQPVLISGLPPQIGKEATVDELSESRKV
jgi:hypothetical protein